jgi:CRP-like cAMP-binding protein
MLLTSVSLFSGLTERTRKAVAELAVEESRERGAFLFQGGDAADYLYVLEHGRVRLKMGGAGHVALIMCTAGDVVGWSSMAGHATYTASAECLDSVKVMKFDRTRLAELLEKDPVSGMNFYRGLTEIIGHRLVASYGATVAVHGERDPKYWG